MKLEVYNCIEVKNLEHEWAVDLSDLKPEMGPDFPNFINVFNTYSLSGNFVVENTICEIKPKKIIDGVNSGLSEDSICAGFWRVKHKTKC